MAQIITEDGTVLTNGISRGYRPPPARRPPPTTADPRERDPHDDHAERDHDVYLRLARAM